MLENQWDKRSPIWFSFWKEKKNTKNPKQNQLVLQHIRIPKTIGRFSNAFGCVQRNMFLLYLNCYNLELEDQWCHQLLEDMLCFVLWKEIDTHPPPPPFFFFLWTDLKVLLLMASTIKYVIFEDPFWWKVPKMQLLWMRKISIMKNIFQTEV